MSESFMRHFEYKVNSIKLLNPMSSFSKELIQLCQKYDQNFPKFVVDLAFHAKPGKINEWKVQAVEFTAVKPRY